MHAGCPQGETNVSMQNLCFRLRAAAEILFVWEHNTSTAVEIQPAACGFAALYASIRTEGSSHHANV